MQNDAPKSWSSVFGVVMLVAIVVGVLARMLVGTGEAASALPTLLVYGAAWTVSLPFAFWWERRRRRRARRGDREQSSNDDDAGRGSS